jgi:hypothetical protein
MKIKFHKKAIEDLQTGKFFYEKQKITLGNYFFDSIISDIESLILYAGIHQKVNNYYRLLAKRFPFAIYYKIEEETILIYAVLDCRQNPIKTNQRLD